MADEQAGVETLIRRQLRDDLACLEKGIPADVMAFVGPIVPGVHQKVRKALEALSNRQPRLAVILETGGGVVEVVERMVDIIRKHYAEVWFFVPDYAMSAGTVFALSGDAIYMDYSSVLGPIDPQVQKDGRLIPALAYLKQFEVLSQKAVDRTLNTADMLLLQKLDPGELQQFQEARELTHSLLRKWLTTYKFKDWTVTETRKTAVTADDRQSRAAEIAELLSNPQRWHSHGRNINMNALREQLKLRIDDFGELAYARTLRDYMDVLREFMQAQQLRNFVHTRDFF